MMKGGVVQNHDLPRLECGQQTGLSPGFKHHSIASTVDCKSGTQLALTVGSNHVDASGAATCLERLESLAPLTPTVPILVTFIPPRFIDRDALGRWNGC
jgi:hypothetical protein